jgi:hypothetical protein
MIRRENSPAFGIALAIVLSILVWAILLFLALSVDKVLGATIENRFVFPDTTKQVILFWHPARDGVIVRGYDVRIIRSGDLLNFFTADTSMIFDVPTLQDSSWAKIAAWNYKGTSAYSDSVKAVFVKGGVGPVVPPAISDLPFWDWSESIASKWTVVSGQAYYTTRDYDFGPGFYIFPGKIKRNIKLDKGAVKIVVDACGFLVNDTLTVSIGTQRRKIRLAQGIHWMTMTYPHVAEFDMSVSGPFELAIEATNAMIKSVSGSTSAEDPAPPGVPLLPGWMKK